MATKTEGAAPPWGLVCLFSVGCGLSLWLMASQCCEGWARQAWLISPGLAQDQVALLRPALQPLMQLFAGAVSLGGIGLGLWALLRRWWSGAVVVAILWWATFLISLMGHLETTEHRVLASATFLDGSEYYLLELRKPSRDLAPIWALAHKEGEDRLQVKLGELHTIARPRRCQSTHGGKRWEEPRIEHYVEGLWPGQQAAASTWGGMYIDVNGRLVVTRHADGRCPLTSYDRLGGELYEGTAEQRWMRNYLAQRAARQ